MTTQHAFSPYGKIPSQLTHVVKELCNCFQESVLALTCVRREARLACPAVVADEDIGLIHIHALSVIESAQQAAGES